MENVLALVLPLGPVGRLSGNKKPPLCGGFLGADEGTRTPDLLHGKQTL